MSKIAEVKNDERISRIKNIMFVKLVIYHILNMSIISHAEIYMLTLIYGD